MIIKMRKGEREKNKRERKRREPPSQAPRIEVSFIFIDGCVDCINKLLHSLPKTLAVHILVCLSFSPCLLAPVIRLKDAIWVYISSSHFNSLPPFTGGYLFTLSQVISHALSHRCVCVHLSHCQSVRQSVCSPSSFSSLSRIHNTYASHFTLDRL